MERVANYQKVTPGTPFVINVADTAIKLVIQLEDGASFEAVVQPGSSVTFTAGKQSADINIYEDIA